MTEQPYQLMQFLNNIHIDNDAVVPKSQYTPRVGMQELYMMNTSVSNFSKSVYRVIKDNNEFTYDYSDTIDGMIPFFNTLVGNLTYRPIYTLFQSIVLESFSMVYMIESGYATTTNFTSDDMGRVHSNIQKVIDTLYYIDVEGAFNTIIQLRALDSNLLYLFSTFSGITYSLDSKYDNSEGKINAFVDSDFKYIDTFYSTRYNNRVVDTDSVLKTIQVSGDNYLVYIGDYSKVTVTTTPIPVYSSSTLSIRALTNNQLTIYAVDSTGRPVDKFVDKDGHIVRDGILATTNESPNGVQIIQGVYVPSGISYIAVSFDIGKATSTLSDRITQPMMVTGYSMGEYVPGMTSLGGNL